MSPSKGYYSLIQYCPDLSRLEAANIGVLLFCPDRQFLKAQTDSAAIRIQKFFGLKKRDRDYIESLRVSIEERLKNEQHNFESLEDLQRFIETRANAIQITPPRTMKVFDPEADLQGLFRRLVIDIEKETPVPAEAAEKRLEPIEETLSKAFSRGEVRNKLWENFPVEVPDLRRTITVPFAFKNGHFNLIQPVHFEAKKHKTVIDKACKYAVEGDSIAQYKDPEFGGMQLVVVGQFAYKQPEVETDVRSLLSKYSVRFFNEEQVNELVDEIITTGKPLP
jgi:hypothetical protein